MSLPTDPATYLTFVAFLTLVVALFQIFQNRKDLAKKSKEIDQKIYETLVLREIGERIGYELNIARILDIIIDSLNQILSFSMAAYLLITDDQTKFNLRLHLEEPVNQSFVNTVKKYMFESLTRVNGKQVAQEDVQEMLTGTILNGDYKDQVSSLWITPIVINSRGVGVLAIASKSPGLYKGTEMEVLLKILNQANRAVNNLETIIASEQRKLNAMVASMADGVIMFDKDLNLLVINSAAENLLGLETIGKPTIFDVARALADKLDLRVRLSECIAQDKMVSLDNLVVGGKFSQLLISPVKDNQQRLIGTVVLFHDRTTEKQLEQIRDEFTTMMVHELRAPLTVVRGTADMFLRSPSLVNESQGQELLKTLRTTSASMLALVNDLLDVAKIEAGKFQIIKKANNLNEVITDRIAFFTPLAQSQSLTITSDLPDPNLILEFDRDRITQVLNNLISNAIKFTPPVGKISITTYKIQSLDEITWRFHQPIPLQLDLPQVVVSISDTGKGIPEDKLSDLFTKFKQLHPVELGPDGMVGTGLGLIIARGIIESHRGKMFVESAVNEGSTFYFTLPTP